MPNGYYRKPAFENADKISGAALAETYLKKNHHCFACPIGCGRVVAIGENDLNLPNGEFEGPEYETLGGFGSLMLNDNLKLIIKANYMCNDLGLDSISASSVIAFLMDLIEQGTITSENLDGIDLKWANMDAVFQLLEKIAYHNGIGALLGEGSMAIGKEFGIDPEQIAAIHNVEPTYHNMRAINGMALTYGISPHYGGSHNSCDYYMNTQGIAFEEIDIQSTDAKDCNPEVAQMAARLMAYRAFYSSIVMCLFANPPATTTAKYLQLITGMDVDLDKVKDWGKRILTLNVYLI